MSFACHLHVICMLFVCAYILPTYTHMPFACQLYVLARHPYVTRMYWYVIRMSLVCTCIPSVCHSYVLIRPIFSSLLFSRNNAKILILGRIVNTSLILQTISINIEMLLLKAIDLCVFINSSLTIVYVRIIVPWSTARKVFLPFL